MPYKITNFEYLRDALESVRDDDLSLPWDVYRCLEWPFGLHPDGYGLIRYQEGSKLVARVAYVEAVGPMPPGGRISLLCGNRKCFRPSHITASPSRFEQFKASLESLTDDLTQPWNLYPCLPWPFAATPEGYGVLAHGGRMWRAHKLAYHLTFGDPGPRLFICHRCDFPPCYRPIHLFSGSLEDNNMDAKIKGRNARGENHNFAVLTENDVLEIRRLYSCGHTQAEVARMFPKIVPGSIHNIVRRKSWTHI